MSSIDGIIRGIQLAEQDKKMGGYYDDDHLSKYSAEQVNNRLKVAINRGRGRIFATGVGGAGSNAIDRLTKTGIPGATTVAINTDARHLLMVQSDLKVLIGEELTKGLGAGNDPMIGKTSAEESYEELVNLFQGVDLVFVTTGLGGGTGTGAAPVVARAAREANALVVSVCTLPFRVEGEVRVNNAMMGLRELYMESDTVIVVPNEKLLEIAPDLAWHAAFKVADEILIRAVKGITNVVIKEQIVSVDLSDIRKILNIGGSAIIGLGQAEGNNKVEEAMNAALSNPLIEADLHSTKGAVLSINGGEDLSLQDIYTAISILEEEISPKAEVIWGATIDPALKDQIEVTAILAGVTSPYEPAPSLEYSEFPPSLFDNQL